MRFACAALVLTLACGSSDPAGGPDSGAADEDGQPGDDGSAGADGSPQDAPVLFQIEFDYRFDDAGFFDEPGRRATLEEAAKSWGRIFSSDYQTIPSGTLVRTRDPEDPDASGMNLELDRDIDDLLIFVGCSTMDGQSGSTAKANHAAAIEAIADSTLREQLRARYRGPDFQPWTGWISFDCDEDWFFDATPKTDDDIPGSDSDFYSVAMHEMGHVLGFGTADAYFELRSEGPMTFDGPAGVAEYGGPVPLSSSGLHLDSGLVSDGRSTLMDPSRPGGTRTPPTSLTSPSSPISATT